MRSLIQEIAKSPNQPVLVDEITIQQIDDIFRETLEDKVWEEMSAGRLSPEEAKKKFQAIDFLKSELMESVELSNNYESIPIDLI